MRYLTIILAMMLAVPAGAADWTDNGDGTFSVTVTVTAPEAIKLRLDKCREWDNSRFRTTADTLDVSAYLEGLLVGLTNTQDVGGASVYGFWQALWASFMRQHVAKGVTDRDAAALAVSIAAPRHPDRRTP